MTFSNFNGDLDERVTDTTANRFKQTYIKGFIDISGGDLITRPSTKIVSQGGITSGWSDASYVFPPDPIQLRKMSDRKYSHLLQSSLYGNGYYHIDVSDGFTVNVPSNATYPTASIIGLFDKGEPDSGFDAYHGLYDGSLKVSNYTLDPSFTVSLPELIKVTDIRLRVYSSSNSPSSTSSIKVYGRTSTNNSFTQISGTNTINGFNGTTPELSFSIIRLKVIPTGKYVGVSQFKVINSAGTDIVLNQTPIQRDMTATTDGLNPLTNLTKTTGGFHSSEVSSLRSLTVCDLNVSGNVFALKEWWIHNAVMGSVNSVNDFQEFWVEFLDSNYNVLYISNGVNVLRENIIGTFGGKVKLYAYDANNTLSATTTSDYFPYRHHLTWVASTETEVTEIRIEPDVTTNDFHINELYIHGRRKQTVQLTDGITFTSNDYENAEDTIDLSYVPHTLLWKGNRSVDVSLDYGMTGWNAWYSNAEQYGGKFANYIMTYVDNQYDGLLSGNFVANTSGGPLEVGKNIEKSPAQLFAVYATDTSGFTSDFATTTHTHAYYDGGNECEWGGTVIGTNQEVQYEPGNISLGVSMYIDASGNNQTIGGHWAQIDFPFELRMTHIHYAVINVQSLRNWNWRESPNHGAFLGWNGTNWVKLCDYTDITTGGPNGAYMSPGEPVPSHTTAVINGETKTWGNWEVHPNRTIPVDAVSIGYYSKLRMVVTKLIADSWNHLLIGPFAASGKVRTQRKTSLQIRHNQNDTELAVYDDNNKDSTLSMRSNKVSFYRSIDNGKKDYIPFFPQCVFATHRWLDSQGGNNTGPWKNYQGSSNSGVKLDNLVKYAVLKRRGNNVAGTYLFYAPYKAAISPSDPNNFSLTGDKIYPIFPFVYGERVTGLAANSNAVRGLESVFTNGTIMQTPFIDLSGGTSPSYNKRAFVHKVVPDSNGYLPYSNFGWQKSLSYIDYDGSPNVTRAGYYVEMMTPNPMRYIHWYARHTGTWYTTGTNGSNNGVNYYREGRDFHLFGRIPNGNLYKLGDCYDLKSKDFKPSGDTWNNNYEVRKVKLARDDMAFVSIVVHLTRVYDAANSTSWAGCFAGQHSFDASPDLYTKLEIRHDDDATRLLAMSRNGIPKNLILNDHTMDNDDANFGHTTNNFTGTLGYSLIHEMGRRTTGMVGIGTSKPVAPLTVYGMNGLEINEALYNKSIIRMGWDISGASESSDSTIQSDGNTSLNYTPCIYGRHSIVTSNYMVARYGLLSASDERIKTNIIDISDSSALDTLRLLAPKTYNYKNPLDMGHRFRTTYGFIAQDVSAIMPDAVTIDTDHIPNIMESGFVFGQTLTISNGDFISALNLDPVLDDFGNRVTDASGNIQYQMPDYDLEVKFATSQRTIEVKVESVIDAKTLLLDATSDLQPYECFRKDASDNIDPGRVFVIGTNVNDFHKVNKSAIFTVVTAALQEVDRQLQVDTAKVDSLETLYAALLARIEALETAGS